MSLVRLVSYRDSRRYPSDPLALATWVQVAQVLARQVVCPCGFEPLQLARALELCRGLTLRTRPRRRPHCGGGGVGGIGRMVTACAAAGVAVVVMPAFARCHASSASQWLGGAEGAEGREGGKRGKGKRGMIALSLRYRRDDQFYFSLFREAGALLAADRQVRKFDPDAFAREFLIPPAYQDRLAAIGGMASPQAKSSAITELAGELGIAPGLVVGRLQHDGLLGWGEQNQLKCEVDLAQVRQATAAAEGTWPSQHSAALLVMKDLNLEAEAARHRVSRAVAGGAILSSGRQRKGLRLEPGQLAAWRLAMRDRDLDAEERDAA